MIGMIQDRNGRLREVNILIDPTYRMVVLGILTKLIHNGKKSSEPEMETVVMNMEYLLEQIINDNPISKECFRYLLKEALADLSIGI